MVAIVLIGMTVYGGAKAVKAADHGAKKVGHAIVHVVKKVK